MNIYEIYTKHPKTGDGGWDIVWVRAVPENISSYPLFDCIITTNDFPVSSDCNIIVDWPKENEMTRHTYAAKQLRL
jgi:hypothetical protein